MITNEKIKDVFRWYRAAMSSVGRKVSWPKAKDITKTYLWRDLKSFVSKMDDLEINDSLASNMIWIIVKYAKDHKLLNRGSSLLTKQDLLDICLNQLKHELNDERELIKEVERCFLFLETESGGNGLRSVLINKKNNKSFANITIWFKSDRITRVFISLSRSCCSVLARLDDDERSCLPSDSVIIKIRNKCLRNTELKEQLKNILGSDLAMGGVA